MNACNKKLEPGLFILFLFFYSLEFCGGVLLTFINFREKCQSSTVFKDPYNLEEMKTRIKTKRVSQETGLTERANSDFKVGL